MKRVYLDHNATCPVDPRVREAMLPLLGEEFGNPSSIHRAGQRARALLERAREQVAALMGCDADEVVFTSGGTEADNFALFGAVRSALKHGIERPRVIVSAVEHSAVLDAARALEDFGAKADILRVDSRGWADPDELRRMLDAENTLLVSVMTANNETGVLMPVEEMCRAAHEAGALFHTDAVQAAGKILLDAHALGADMMSVSAHKFYGPKGVGALYIRRETPMEAFVAGGGQEESRRGGTENIAGVVGMGVAADLARTEFLDAAPRVEALRDKLEKGILGVIPDVAVNGEGAPRVGNTSNLTIRRAEGEAVLISLDLKGVSVSTGSACASGAIEPSHVLQALGLPREDAKSSVRLSLGVGTTEEDISYVLDVLPKVVGEIRRLAP